MPRGEIPEEKTEAFIDGISYTIARNRMTYNAEGKRITSEDLAGQVTTTAWEQFACIPVGELISAAKNAKSAKAAYDFDDIGNRESSSERGTNSVYSANQLNKDKELKCGGYDFGVDVESDEVQIYGPLGKSPPAGRYLW